ncbi:MAG: PEGA domain-containing protein, partial [Nitrospirota bacterium]
MFARKATILIVAIVFIFTVTGCATIMQGTTQSIGIGSVPTSAVVTINNVEKGRTPVVVELKRKEHHIVKIEMPGYLPYETTFTRST